MSNKYSSNTMFSWVGSFLLLLTLFSWTTIPNSVDSIGAFRIFSLNLVNGIFVGWADNIISALFYSNPDAALTDFKNAILMGEQNYKLETAIANILGAFLSIGGLFALYLAKNAPDVKSAFSYGFWAEIVEGAVFHVGYYKTVGVSALSGIEVIITLVVALIMGSLAVKIRNKSQ